ncbi:MAG: four helix bundle protein [Patescibacteria group bacterium]|nr:four helix bundle protein [Patescibacteria group bacterium]
MTYRDLDVYQRSYRLAVRIHNISLGLPREYRFDIADQIRRSPRSIPLNIAEGFGRCKSIREYVITGKEPYQLIKSLN